jgi:hypothetical protein
MRLVRMVLVLGGTEALEQKGPDISKIISRAAYLAELTSNPKSFFNCPDLHGGVPGLPEVVAQKERLASLGEASVEFAHANNPIPEVSGNGISRFTGVSW